MAKYLSKLNGYEIKDAVARAKDQEQDTLLNELGGKVSLLEAMVGGDTELPSITSEVTEGSSALVTSGGVYNAVNNVANRLDGVDQALTNRVATNETSITGLKTTTNNHTVSINTLNQQTTQNASRIDEMELNFNTSNNKTLNDAKAYTNTKLEQTLELAKGYADSVSENLSADVDEKLEGKANKVHSHSEYYTTNQTDLLLNAKANASSLGDQVTFTLDSTTLTITSK